jgi:hypothetical protein
MKNGLLNMTFAIIFLFQCCSAQKKVITSDDLSEDKVLLIGLVEYDFSQLKNKKIRGIDLFIDSKQKFSDFALSGKYFPDEYDKRYQFISKIGYKGEYELCYNRNSSYTPETDHLLTLMDQQRNAASSERKTLQRYSINDGKIINLGKVIVKYSGGTVEEGSTKYFYSFHSVDNDTTALHAFKQSYPLLFDKCKNEIYSFDSEVE